MLLSHRYDIRLLPAMAGLLIAAAWPSQSAAGPARYDPATRSFSLNYTYASLPHFGMTPAEVETLGAPQSPETDQDDKVRALHQQVSQVLSEITDGRAKVGSLSYVKDIKTADIVISLTGNFNRAGWAISGAIEGRPGQVGLYYQYLAAPQRSHQDIVLTVAHELGHYLFSLPDEYSNSDPNAASCPLKNPGGPGCLMDNYMTRHGFLALCTGDDHNANGPRQNPGTIVQGHTANDSCRDIIERFFRDHPPSASSSSSGSAVGADDPTTATGATSAAGLPRPTPENPFMGRFRRVVESAVSFTREHAEGDENQKRREGRDTLAASSSELSALGKVARGFLLDQVQALRDDPDFAPITKTQLDAAVKLVAKRATERTAERPASLTRDVVTTLRQQAQVYASQEMTRKGRPSNATGFLQMLVGNPAETDKQLQPTVDSVKKLLIKFALTAVRKSLIGFSPPSKLTNEEMRYIEQIAREAVKGSGDPSSDFSTYFEAAKLHTRISENAAETLNAVASELNVPGAENRRLALVELNDLLSKFALPGRPFTRPGFRRTFIIAPYPIDPRLDYVPVDAGDRIPYHEIRGLALTQFMSLLQRERIVLLNDPTIVPQVGATRFASGAIDFGPPPEGMTSGQRFAHQVALINALSEEIRGDRVENIIMLVPPGGLGPETGDALEVLRQRVLTNGGVRVDLVIPATNTVPLRLRDLAHKSGGTVQTAVDIDETAAISQRIKNDLASGSWVTTPEQGYIDLSPVVQGAVLREDRPAATRLSVPDLQMKYVGSSAALPGHVAEAINQGHANAANEARIRVRVKRGLAQMARARNEGLDPVIDIAKQELDKFSTRVENLIYAFAKGADTRPDSFDRDVKATITRLADLRDRLETIDGLIRRIDSPPSLAHFDTLLAEIEGFKIRLRRALKGVPLFDSPLEDTDDYLDWNLRRRLLKRVDLMEEFVTREGAILPAKVRSDILAKASYLVRRTTIRDPRLAEIDHDLYVNRLEMQSELRWQLGTATEIENWLGSGLVSRQQQEFDSLSRSAAVIERESNSNTPDAPEYLLKAAELLSKAIDARMVPGMSGQGGSISGDLFLYALDREASFLERASRLGADYDGLNFGLEALRTQIDQVVKALKIKRDDPGVPELYAKVDLLSRRLEALLPVRNLTPKRPKPKPITLDIEDSSLQPLVTAIQAEEAIKQRWNGWRNAPKSSRPASIWERFRFAPTPGLPADEDVDQALRRQLANYLWIETIQDNDHAYVAVRYRFDDLIEADFPELLLSLLGHARMLEDDLYGTQELLTENRVYRSPSERLAERRRRATIEIGTSRTGTEIEIAFRPFQAERDAHYEIVLGLSRPLRDFETLKQFPPELRLYRDKNLEEKPYLDFVAEVSTPTMLVFRAPKPILSAGVLGEGVYTPKLMIKREFFPIVGRDNTINYTFTVATPRPNVQLIAALRQPQPREGREAEIDPTKNPEYAYRGTIPANLTDGVVEVQVLAGASVRKAQVSGVYQRFDKSPTAIDTPNLTFADDGVYPDFVKEDGVYTARITLLPSTKRIAAEYRVIVQAKWTEDSAFIPLAEALPRREGTEEEDLSKVVPPVPPFQRATSLNFHAAGEN